MSIRLKLASVLIGAGYIIIPVNETDTVNTVTVRDTDSFKTYNPVTIDTTMSELSEQDLAIMQQPSSVKPIRMCAKCWIAPSVPFSKLCDKCK